MKIIRDEKRVIEHLNDVLFTLNAKETAQHLDDIISMYMAYKTRGEYSMAKHEAEIVMSTLLARDLFFFIERNTNSYEEEGEEVIYVINEENEKEVIAYLNEMLFTLNTKETARHLDAVIFDYIKYKTRGEYSMSKYEADIVMTAQRVRGFFYYCD